jgi:hypothetical protein
MRHCALYSNKKSCLAAIIVAALLKNCFEVKKVIELFKKSKPEAVSFFISFNLCHPKINNSGDFIHIILAVYLVEHIWWRDYTQY